MSQNRFFLYAVLISNLLVIQNGNSAENTDIKQFKRLLTKQNEQLQAQQKMLDAQNRQLSELQARLDSLSDNQPTSTTSSSAHKERQQSKQANQSSHVEQQKIAANSRPRLKEMPKDTKPPEIPRVSADVGGVLTPKGRLVVEPQVQYTYSKSQRVALAGYTVGSALFIGIADVRDVKREAESVALTGRYGLTERIELEAKIPYMRREDTSQTRSVVNPNATDKFFSADGMDIGDIEVAGHYQITDGQRGWPFLIGNLRIKTDTGTSPFEMPVDASYFLPTKLNTGTGFWSFQPSLTAIFPSDPSVFYANVSYLWNVERNISNRVIRLNVPDKDGKVRVEEVKSGGKTDPGDAIGFSFGTSLAFNEKASFSLGYSHSIYFKTSQNGKNIDGSDFDVGQFTFGLNYTFAKKTSANLAVAIGATRDAPDVQMTLRIPFGIDL